IFLGAAVIVGLALLTRTSLPSGWRDWVRIIPPAVFGSALPFTLFAIGERSVDSGVAGVLNATTPLWALLLTMLVGTERHVGLLRTVGLLVGFGGTLLIFAPWHAAGLASWGALACLLAAISYALSYTYISRFLLGRMSSVTLSAAQLTGGAVLVAVIAPATGGLDQVHLGVGPLVAVTILGVFGTGIAQVMNNRLLADEGVMTATSVGYLLPVVSVLLGALFLHEDLNARILIGMVVVLAGVALSRKRSARAAAPQVAQVQTSLRSVAQRESS
ncbi:MAG TPA: DMT family transporter, partial [Pseudonocardiaceae bacterium]|nr:DMT family transporter [Pseudonocardiaceae bacterium]